ncbi:MAG: amino-acid N-acetyltransferase, partial [Thiothrix sp.]
MPKHNHIETVSWFRNAAPYIHQHRNKTFVVYFSGAAVASAGFEHLIHDLALLHSLGIRLVLVHGARPQIEARLALEKIEAVYAQGLRVTDTDSLGAVVEAAGRLRVIVEGKLSLSLENTPMSGSKLRVCSGNYITARPMGIRDGVDFQHTGMVRKVDIKAIRQQLANEQCVLFSPLGYSPTGEIFNLSGEEVATRTAIALRADKLILLNDEPDFELPSQLDLNKRENWPKGDLPPNIYLHLKYAKDAIKGGVTRCHIIDRHIDGGLLLELFSRDGRGTLVSAGNYDGLRSARIKDINGVLELIAPLEAQGMLVRRSREQLELEINLFSVIERDGLIIACAALFPFTEEAMGELACLAVHPDYQGDGRGESVLKFIEESAISMGLKSLFVLSTHTMHWFQERGYQAGEIEQLPIQRAELYNYQRKSRIFLKTL